MRAASMASPRRFDRPLVASQLALEQLEIADDDGQQIVEIMGEAAGQLADRLHLLRPLQRGGRPCAPKLDDLDEELLDFRPSLSTRGTWFSLHGAARSRREAQFLPRGTSPDSSWRMPPGTACGRRGAGFRQRQWTSIVPAHILQKAWLARLICPVGATIAMP